MDKQERNKAIEKVRRLYTSYRKIELYERQIGNAKRELDHVIREQKELNYINIDAQEGFCTSYEEKVSCTRDVSSKAEKEIERYIENLIIKEVNLRNEITEKRLAIKEINEEFEGIKWNIEHLESNSKAIIECICRDRHDISYLINTVFFGVKSTAYDHLDKALTKILEFEENWRGQDEG